MVHHNEDFTPAIHLKSSKFKNRITPSQICKIIMIFMGFASSWILIHNHSNYWSGGDNNEILIIIFQSFLNKNITMKMDCCYNENTFTQPLRHKLDAIQFFSKVKLVWI